MSVVAVRAEGISKCFRLGAAVQGRLTETLWNAFERPIRSLKHNGAPRDEIVSFAEVERFIDTPVKRYSSGMYMRLAFAVAAHLEPEILMVDEVLSVGDAAFQKKCLGRISDVAREGRTVLFVSHNLPSVEKLCQRVVVIDGGRVVMQGDPVACIAAYLGARTEPKPAVDLAVVPRLDRRLVPVYTRRRSSRGT